MWVNAIWFWTRGFCACKPKLRVNRNYVLTEYVLNENDCSMSLCIVVFFEEVILYGSCLSSSKIYQIKLNQIKFWVDFLLWLHLVGEQSMLSIDKRWARLTESKCGKGIILWQQHYQSENLLFDTPVMLFFPLLLQLCTLIENARR